MRIIARRTLRDYVASLARKKDQAAVRSALEAWFFEVSRAAWKNPADVRKHYAMASVVNAERVVFNIKGNDHRLIVAVDYEKQIVWIKWLGSHRAYDKIDAAEIDYGD